MKFLKQNQLFDRARMELVQIRGEWHDTAPKMMVNRLKKKKQY